MRVSPGVAQMFADMAELAKVMGRTACGRQVIPLSMNCVLMFCGFSCKTASGLNCGNQDANTSYISDEHGSTGVTFGHLKSILRHKRPRALLLENVVALMTVKGVFVHDGIPVSVCVIASR